MKHSDLFIRKNRLRLILTGFVALMASALPAQFLVTSPTYTYTQDFGTSVISAAGVNITSGTANLTGWSYDAALTSELNITAAAPTNTGGRYAYTLNGNNNRKIGARPSGGTNDVSYGILFRNTSGQTIKSFSVSYTGYQLSLGGNTNSVINKLTVDYLVSASSIAMTAGAGTPMPSLDFSQTQFVAAANTGGQGTGYPAAPGSGVNSGCISVAASIPNNSYLLIRWTDLDDSQNDPHLAIDNVEVIFFTNQTVSNNTACSLLPVELLDFYAQDKGSENEIGWKVAQEEHITAYILERSENGIDFTELETVDLSASSETVKDYTISDPLPGKDITYYRLSALEKNGIRKFYHTVSLENKAAEWSGVVYQNAEELIVEFKYAIPEKGNIELYDLSGNLMSSDKVEGYKQAIDISTIRGGLYFIRITSQSKTEHFKLYLSK